MDAIDRRLSQFHYPYSDLDWRWQRARSLVKAGREPGLHTDDPHVKKAVKFLQDLAATGDDALANFDLSRAHPAIAAAVSLRQHKGYERYYLEALLLCSDADMKEIGDMLSPSGTQGLGMVRAYERLFMDVRSNLQNPLYIHSKVLQPLYVREGMSGSDPDFAWKLGGLYGGKRVVNTFWKMGPTAPDIFDWFNSATQSAMQRNLAFGAFLMPTNQYTLTQIAEYVIRDKELQLKRDAVGLVQDVEGSKEQFFSDLVGCMSGVFEVGSKVPGTDKVEPRMMDYLSQFLANSASTDADLAREIEVAVSEG